MWSISRPEVATYDTSSSRPGLCTVWGRYPGCGCRLVGRLMAAYVIDLKPEVSATTAHSVGKRL